MSNIHNNGTQGAGSHSAANGEAMKRAFYLTVNVQVHAHPDSLHENLLSETSALHHLLQS